MAVQCMVNGYLLLVGHGGACGKFRVVAKRLCRMLCLLAFREPFRVTHHMLNTVAFSYVHARPAPVPARPWI